MISKVTPNVPFRAVSEQSCLPLVPALLFPPYFLVLYKITERSEEDRCMQKYDENLTLQYKSHPNEDCQNEVMWELGGTGNNIGAEPETQKVPIFTGSSRSALASLSV